MASLNSFSVGLSLVFDLIHAVTYSEIECKKHCSDGSFFKHPPPHKKKKKHPYCTVQSTNILGVNWNQPVCPSLCLSV